MKTNNDKVDYQFLIDDEIETIEGYDRMIQRSTNDNERALLEHIKKEEEQHVKELKNAQKGNYTALDSKCKDGFAIKHLDRENYYFSIYGDWVGKGQGVKKFATKEEAEKKADAMQSNWKKYFEIVPYHLNDSKCKDAGNIYKVRYGEENDPIQYTSVVAVKANSEEEAKRKFLAKYPKYSQSPYKIFYAEHDGEGEKTLRAKGMSVIDASYTFDVLNDEDKRYAKKYGLAVKGNTSAGTMLAGSVQALKKFANEYLGQDLVMSEVVDSKCKDIKDLLYVNKETGELMAGTDALADFYKTHRWDERWTDLWKETKMESDKELDPPNFGSKKMLNRKIFGGRDSKHFTKDDLSAFHRIADACCKDDIEGQVLADIKNRFPNAQIKKVEKVSGWQPNWGSYDGYDYEVTGADYKEVCNYINSIRQKHTTPNEILHFAGVISGGRVRFAIGHKAKGLFDSKCKDDELENEIKRLLKKYHGDEDRVIDELRKKDWGIPNGDLQGMVEAYNDYNLF